MSSIPPTSPPFAEPQISDPTSVLFMCTFNMVRSPMAEALAKYLCGHRIYIQSAGIRAEEDQANPFAMGVMDEIGLDIESHTPINFDDLEDDSFDLIISLSPEAHHKAMDMTRTLHCDVEYWPTIDPTATAGNREAIMDAFRQVREHLKKRIMQRFDVTHSPGL